MDSLVQPDVFVVAPEHATDEWDGIRQLRLVAEVLSPSTARRLIETWAPEQMLPIVEAERVSWHPRGAGQPLVLELDEIFKEQ
jgi:hypothetical protein